MTTPADAPQMDRGEACARLGIHAGKIAAEAVATMSRSERPAYLVDARKIAANAPRELGDVTDAETDLALDAFDKTVDACLQSARDGMPVDFRIIETGVIAASFEPQRTT